MTHIHPHSSTNPDEKVSEELRGRVYDLLARAMINGLELLNPEIFNEKDSEDSAEMIATTLDHVKTKHELLTFLKHLSDRWEVYRPVYLEFVPIHMVLNAEDLQRSFARANSDILKHAGIIVEWKGQHDKKTEHISLEEAMTRLKQMGQKA